MLCIDPDLELANQYFNSFKDILCSVAVYPLEKNLYFVQYKNSLTSPLLFIASGDDVTLLEDLQPGTLLRDAVVHHDPGHHLRAH